MLLKTGQFLRLAKASVLNPAPRPHYVPEHVSPGTVPIPNTLEHGFLTLGSHPDNLQRQANFLCPSCPRCPEPRSVAASPWSREGHALPRTPPFLPGLLMWLVPPWAVTCSGNCSLPSPLPWHPHLQQQMAAREQSGNSGATETPRQGPEQGHSPTLASPMVYVFPEPVWP